MARRAQEETPPADREFSPPGPSRRDTTGITYDCRRTPASRWPPLRVRENFSSSSCIRSNARVQPLQFPGLAPTRVRVTRVVIGVIHLLEGVMDFFSSWTFIIIMAALLVALIGLLIYLRKQGSGD